MAVLAELINVKDKAAIELFIRCVRRALWLDILRHQLRLGFWISSALLLLAGLINLFFHNMLISLSLTLGLLPIAGGINVAIKKMPTFANAASHADNLFKGKSLMTTATELLYTPPTAPRDFSPWIIQQAAQTAQLWHEQFKRPTYYKQNQFPWAAMGIALLGFFFILQPGVSDKHEVTTVESKALPTDSKPALVDSLINEIRKEENALQNETLSSQDELTKDFSSTDKQALLNTETQAQPNKKQKQVNDLASNTNKDNAQAARAENSQGSEAFHDQLQHQNQRADAGIGTQADTTLALSLHKDTHNMDIRFVDIELQDGTLVSSDGKGMPFTDRQFTGSDQRTRLPSISASRNTSTAYTSRFSPSQQHYVNAYFKNSPMENENIGITRQH